MIHVTSLRVELSEQVTTPKILICNINNETIKFVAAANNFIPYSVYRLEITAIFMMSRRS